MIYDDNRSVYCPVYMILLDVSCLYEDEARHPKYHDVDTKYKTPC